MSLRELSTRDLARKLKNVKKWNRERIRDPGFQPNLAGQDLSGYRLSRANLSSANLRNTILTRARLERADLSGADFEGADLTNADFHDADLSGAHLNRAHGLGALQLKGAKLARAKLPDKLEFHGLKAVEETSKNARAFFLILLTSVFFSVVTSFVDDFKLITNSGTVKLPIINTDVQITLFFVVTPFILLLFFTYLFLYIEHLCNELGQLPAIFPDGETLGQRAFPWLLTGIVRMHMHHLMPSYARRVNMTSVFRHWNLLIFRARSPKRRPSFSQCLKVTLHWVLVWQLSSITILIFWMSYLRCHSLLMNIWFIFLLSLSALIGAHFQSKCRHLLRQDHKHTFDLRKRFLSVFPVILIVSSLSLFSIFGKAKTSLIFISDILYTKIHWNDFNPDATQDLKNAESNLDTQFTPSKREQNSTKMENGFCAILENVIQKEMKTKNFNHSDFYQTSMIRLTINSPSFIGANLSNVNFSGSLIDNADFHSANLSKTNFSCATISSSNFSYSINTGDLTPSRNHNTVFKHAEIQSGYFFEAVLPNSDFSKAELTNANLISSNLSRSIFKETILIDCNVHGSNLKRVIIDGAILTYSSFRGSDLSFVDFCSVPSLSEIDFQETTLNSAKFIGVQIRNSNFTRSDLKNTFCWQADFSGLEFMGANFSGAKLAGVKFIGSNLHGAIFSFADLTCTDFFGADLSGALLHGVNLKEAKNLSIDQIKSARIDENTIFPDYLIDQLPELNED